MSPSSPTASVGGWIHCNEVQVSKRTQGFTEPHFTEVQVPCSSPTPNYLTRSDNALWRPLIPDLVQNTDCQKTSQYLNVKMKSSRYKALLGAEYFRCPLPNPTKPRGASQVVSSQRVRVDLSSSQ